MGTYKQFTGSAVVAHLTAAITGTPASFTVDSATGFPTAGTGQPPFVVCVDRGTSTEEKILCSGQGSGVFTIQTRGWDGTTQTNHANGATVEHTIDADTMNDSQQHIHVATRDDHTQYAKVDGTRAFTGAVTVSAGGAQVTGNSKVTGTLEVTQATTIDSGGLTVTAGGITVAAGTTAVQALTGTTITGTGEIQGTDLKATGLTGATAASRHVGATASGAPTTGTFAVGDFVIDQTGFVWVCTVAGTPGTWVQIGVTGGATDAAWTNVSTFTNTWQNSPSTGEPAASYRKVNGRVYLRGAINVGNIGLAAFTLPAGYRPSATLSFTCAHFDSTNGWTASAIQVLATGAVVPQNGNAGNGLYLDQISFDTL